MGRRFLLPVGLPVAHFVDETLPVFRNAFLEFRESIEAHLIEITVGRGFREAVLMVRG